MKRLLSLTTVLLLTIQVNGQKSAIQTAYNWMRYEEFDKAKEAIDGAATNESTIGMAKTWYYRGSIYQGIHQSNNPKFDALKPGSLSEAAKSYQKALELDQKQEFSDDIKKRLAVVAAQALNEGVDKYKADDFSSAIAFFQTSIEINQNLFGRTDTVALYNRALAANKSGNADMAIKDFEYLVKVNYGGSKIFSLLGNMYLDRKDTTNALLRINEGRRKYPDDNTLITQALNIYLNSGRDQEALRENDEAIKADPGNHILYYIKGNLQDKIGNKTEAVLAYKKCLELKPDYFDANYNLGAMYFNEGAELSNKANAIPTSKMAEYDAMKKKFEAKFKEALPYLEKAHAINPTDVGTMQSLRQLYTRMGNLEKASEIKKKMEGQ